MSAEGGIVGTKLQLRPEETFQRRKRPRLPKFGYICEFAYHLILVTKGRQAVFADDVAATQCCSTLQSIALERGFELIAYCLMPDHLHVLAKGIEPSANLLRLVQRFKQQTAFEYKRRTSDVLWQTSFFDRTLRKDEALEDVAEYIFANPVEAGLVGEPFDFAYAGGLLHPRSIVSDGAEASSLRGAGSTLDAEMTMRRGLNHD